MKTTFRYAAVLGSLVTLTCLGDIAATASEWTGRVGWVHMWREDPGNIPLLVTSNPGGLPAPNLPVFNASQFDFDGASGIDASVVYDAGRCNGLEFRYLWIDDFSDAPGSFGAGTQVDILTNPRNQFIIGPMVPAYKSEMQSAEILGRRSMGRFAVTYGLRYIELDESLTFDAVQAPAPFPRWSFDAINHLWGFQLGVDGQLWTSSGGSLRLDGFAKIGIYGNDAGASTMSVIPANPGNQGMGSASGGGAAFVSEFGLFATYDITRDISLRAGYQLLLLDGVALAADQVPNTGNLFANPNTPVNVHTGNSLVFQGVQVGLEYRF